MLQIDVSRGEKVILLRKNCTGKTVLATDFTDEREFLIRVHP